MPSTTLCAGAGELIDQDGLQYCVITIQTRKVQVAQAAESHVIHANLCISTRHAVADQILSLGNLPPLRCRPKRCHFAVVKRFIPVIVKVAPQSNRLGLVPLKLNAPVVFVVRTTAPLRGTARFVAVVITPNCGAVFTNTSQALLLRNYAYYADYA